jgi:hypothetical protein
MIQAAGGTDSTHRQLVDDAPVEVRRCAHDHDRHPDLGADTSRRALDAHPRDDPRFIRGMRGRLRDSRELCLGDGLRDDTRDNDSRSGSD